MSQDVMWCSRSTCFDTTVCIGAACPKCVSFHYSSCFCLIFENVTFEECTSQRTNASVMFLCVCLVPGAVLLCTLLLCIVLCCVVLYCTVLYISAPVNGAVSYVLSTTKGKHTQIWLTHHDKLGLECVKMLSGAQV